tara:strand:+ start:126 stop:569 length:444 start_codon:yes stop_codon:yes gene_type:complete
MGKYRAPFLNNDVVHIVENNKEPEQKLWVAVLAKAFDDAFYCTNDRAALDALSWIRHGSNFNYVCGLAGRDPDYVRKKMLDKVIMREAQILMEHKRIKEGVDNAIKLKNIQIQKEILKPKRKKKRRKWGNVSDFKWLPKYTHDYVER